MASFEDAGKFGKEFMDSGLTSFAAVTKSMQTIATEASEFARSSFENGSAAVEKMISAKSPDKAFQVQADYAKSAYEAFVAQATKMGDLYAAMAKDAYKPFEAIAAKAK
ncbi:MAG TPA: phasin family protein [Rhizobiaceae bacterium]|nr:phasin family protein [Rhizobiaceae bacterium]